MVKTLVISVLSLALAVSLVLNGLLLFRKGPRAAPPASAAATAADDPAIPGPGEELADPSEAEPEPAQIPVVAALAAVFAEAAGKASLDGAAIGFCAVAPDGETLYERSGKVALIPASALKTVTTATALELLGPTFTFETRLGTSTPEPGSVADLVLLGGGDPTLAPTDLASWAKGLAEAGVQSIPGRIVGDGRHFDGSPFADFWNWGDIGNGYGSPVSGLNLGHNRFTAVFSPGENEGDPALLLGTFPEVPGVSWWNETRTAATGSGDGVVIHGGERAAVMHLRGTVPLGGELQVVGAIPDPERFAAHHLREALLAAGIQVAGEAVGAGELFLRGEAVPEIGSEILLHRSAPLLEIVTSIHATSDNHETECLYRTLGLRTRLAPDDAIREHWRKRGLELAGLRMVDGSGLARADHITPESLARLQHFAAGGPAGEAYLESLLVLDDGSIRFKAGAMSSIRSYTGLVEGPGGRLAFALIANHYPDGGAIRELQGAVFEALRLWSSEATEPEE
jgi:D-alanyl-D-alanine carboxypeptidase/D-alanyl-D-alanine-endopeptidase (penicillin-binding protein 4)